MELNTDQIKVLKAIQADAALDPFNHFRGDITDHLGMDAVKIAMVSGVPLEALLGKPIPEPKRGQKRPPVNDEPDGILEKLQAEGLIGLVADEIDGREYLGATWMPESAQVLQNLPPSV